MKVLSKALSVCLSLGCIVTAVSAQAQQAQNDGESSKSRAVLFKIHDIKPVTNTDGLITDCDFLVTFYNRTQEGLRPAKIEMGWVDNVSDRYMVESADAAADQNENGRKNYTRPDSARNVAAGKLGDITTSVDMPALASQMQTTVKGSVKTEKCFVLLDALQFNVANCGFAGKEVNGEARRNSTIRSNAECANLFQYVDSKNPEYYEEFKSLSYSEQERLLNDSKQIDLSDINAKYEEVVSNVEKTNAILNNIQ